MKRLIIVFFVWIHLFASCLLYSETNSTTITLSPRPDTVAPGSLISGFDGNMYMCGVLSGNEGLLKITPQGNVSLFVPVVGSNSVTADMDGKYVYSIYQGTITKISLLTGLVENIAVVNPNTSGYAIGTLVESNNSLFVDAAIAPPDHLAIVKISTAGALSILIDNVATGSLTRDLTGKYLYYINSSTFSPTSINKISIADNLIISSTTLIPRPDSYVAANFEVDANENGYLIGILNGAQDLLKIDKDGYVTVFDSSGPQDLSMDITGENLYVLKFHDISSQSASLSAKKSHMLLVDTSNKDVSITKYALVFQNNKSTNENLVKGASLHFGSTSPVRKKIRELKNKIDEGK